MASKGNSVQAIDGTVDWLTATTTSRRSGFDWYEIFRKYQAKVADRTGYPPVIKEASRHGYKGRVGEGMFYGKHDTQGYLFVSWGEASEMVWPMIAPSAKRISRVDLAVTIELPESLPELAQRGFEANRGVNQRKYAIIQNSAGGSTLYVGSRQSDQYGRLYDKGLKDLGQDAGLTWRYEIELKSKPSNFALMKTIYNRWRLNGVVKDDILQYVHQWFYVRGVKPVFSASGRGLPKPDTEATVTTAEKKLRWLTSQVAPTVQELIDIGLGDRALLALGLHAEQLPFWDANTIEGKEWTEL